MLVRRLSEAPVLEVHRLRARILMDAGELGSRNLSANWIEVPAGASEELRSDEEAEQIYIVVSGSGTLSATGDAQTVAVGDLVLIPPSTDHSIVNDGDGDFALVAVHSPAVAADELYSRRLAAQASGYDDEYDDDYE
ncbi:MAG: cupin domain-containing protein [Solirubrobacterales bacterium]|nr:cupin domain-containing protein [Solirubrobacterales bacterium]